MGVSYRWISWDQFFIGQILGQLGGNNFVQKKIRMTALNIQDPLTFVLNSNSFMGRFNKYFKKQYFYKFVVTNVL